MDMHETAKRLLAVGLARGAESFAEIARWLGESDQTATNWKSPKRGVSKQGVLKAAEYFGVDALWLSGSPTGKRPSWLPDGSEDAPSDIVDERRGAHHPNTAPGPDIRGSAETPPTIAGLLARFRGEVVDLPEPLRKAVADLVSDYLKTPDAETGQAIAAAIEHLINRNRP